MASTSSSKGSRQARPAEPGGKAGALLVYYGRGELATLAGYRRVVLQPTHYDGAELRALAEAGTQALAYLSLGEDTGPDAPWQRPRRNPEWGGRYVYLGHPGWAKQLQASARTWLQRGFQGLFLDTLDTVDLFPEERGEMLELVARLRKLAHGRYLLANRGFSLLPELAELIDGFLFEAFSSTWCGERYAALPPRELLHNVMTAQRLQATGRDLYALDYALTPQLAAFARDRALRHGFTPLISNRDLTQL